MRCIDATKCMSASLDIPNPRQVVPSEHLEHVVLSQRELHCISLPKSTAQLFCFIPPQTPMCAGLQAPQRGINNTSSDMAGCQAKLQMSSHRRTLSFQNNIVLLQYNNLCKPPSLRQGCAADCRARCKHFSSPLKVPL